MAGLLNYTKGYQGGGVYIPTSTRVRGQYGYLDRLFTEDIREKGEKAEEQMAGLKAKGQLGSLGGKMLGMYLGRKMLTHVLGGGLKTALTSSVARTALLSNPWAIAAAIAAPTVLSYLGKMAPLGLKKNPLTGKAFDRPEDVKKGFKVDGRTSKFRQSEYADIAEAMTQQRKTAKELALAEAPGEAIGAAKGYAQTALSGAAFDKYGGMFEDKPDFTKMSLKELDEFGMTDLPKGHRAYETASARLPGASSVLEQADPEFSMTELDPSHRSHPSYVDPFVETGRKTVDPREYGFLTPPATVGHGYEAQLEEMAAYQDVPPLAEKLPDILGGPDIQESEAYRRLVGGETGGEIWREAGGYDDPLVAQMKSKAVAGQVVPSGAGTTTGPFLHAGGDPMVETPTVDPRVPDVIGTGRAIPPSASPWSLTQGGKIPEQFDYFGLGRDVYGPQGFEAIQASSYNPFYQPVGAESQAPIEALRNFQFSRFGGGGGSRQLAPGLFDFLGSGTGY